MSDTQKGPTERARETILDARDARMVVEIGDMLDQLAERLVWGLAVGGFAAHPEALGPEHVVRNANKMLAEYRAQVKRGEL